MELEIYYDKKADALVRVIDGILVNYDEAITSSEFIGYFGYNVETIDDLREVTVEEIMEGYDGLLADFKGFESEEFIREHFENVYRESIRGELLFSKEINAQWLDSNYEKMKLLMVDSDVIYNLR